MSKNPSVLIVDDSLDTLRLTGLVFHRAGYEVHTARSGAEALSKLATAQPDLLILDVMMPDMSGLEVCQRLRASPDTALLPIIMVSAKGFIDDRINGFEAGTDDYVSKPADPQELLARAKALLHRASYSQKPAARTFAVVGAKGGAGTTMVAVNLAATLGQHGHSVVLVELRPDRGTVAACLNLATGHDLVELLALEPENINGRNVAKRVGHHATGLRLLPAPAHNRAAPLTAEHVESILVALQKQFELIVLDLPSVTAPGVRPALESSNHILLVTEPERLSATCAKTDLETLESWGLRDQTSLVLVARTNPDIALSRTEVENLLKPGREPERLTWPVRDSQESAAAGIIRFHVPAAAEPLQEALHRHEPLVLAFPNLVVTKVFNEMARVLAEETPMSVSVD
jgi:CheY-like chemotaxis protein/MinD-like ATPase involved in chromosome partitioning or flagellar assembly